MKIVLFKDLKSYSLTIHELSEFPLHMISGNIVFNEKMIPVGRIATDKDIKRGEFDYNEEWGI